MKSIYTYLILLSLFFVACTSNPEGELLTNHLGYDANAIKKVIFQTTTSSKPQGFEVMNEAGEVVYKGTFQEGGRTDQWHTGAAFAGYFTEVTAPGKYTIQVKGTETQTPPFEIKEHLLASSTLPLILKGFQSIHPAEEYEEWDKAISFFGDRTDTVDVHGGWYDASGDYSKYLSHLCYTNFMAPQQTPLVVYNLYDAALRMEQRYPELAAQYVQEAAYGADFLVRMQDPEGYFYTTIFDTWSKDPSKREVCAYETQNGTRTDEYQAAFREGAGISIAALARLSAAGISGEYDSTVYLETAEKGFAHLLENNPSYCDDGRENIIDDYCALMAATELFNATKKPAYLDHARMRAENLNKRISKNDNYSGWFTADQGTRPYFHAAEAGYPLIALNRYLDLEEDQPLREKAIATIQQHLDFTLSITNEVVNPFGYPRQYVKAIDEAPRASFFIPHKNESGYWYQGENARLASLAAAFKLCNKYLRAEQNESAREFYQDQVNWILGLNPFNISMLDGIGYNNPEYLDPHDWNYEGGIANGITAGVDNEADIAFLPSPQNEDPAQLWRWPEQWIPHAGWFILAVTGGL
ncbi:chitobiase [Robertkochia marina]|uniref:Chitobiase n=1 Tax=Robertkochia marina TaxID=1227945 RepID=A0A4S3M344_9FLAO|nr:glycoside hydrolase family 9 protein [Robertkochia marina]THD69135.1 chitobiase [Robertkochia marina]TRZ47605.1 chitobiase [Robertkochia marina]